jgi:hypothetical protein
MVPKHKYSRLHSIQPKTHSHQPPSSSSLQCNVSLIDGRTCMQRNFVFKYVYAYVTVGVTKTNFRISGRFTLFMLNEYYLNYVLMNFHAQLFLLYE